MTKTTEPIGSLVYEHMELKKKAKDPHNTGKRKYPRALRRVESVCQILVKMQEQLIFLLAALTAGISSLTAMKSTRNWFWVQCRYSAGTMSVQPVQVEHGEGRQANINPQHSKPF